MSEVRFLPAAREGWGAGLPDWVEALARAADQDGLARVAQRCSMGGSTAHEVIRNTYRGVVANQEVKVRAALMRDVVACPVLGDISGAVCLAHQGEPYRPHNPLRVQLFIACRGCVHNTAIGSRQSAVGGEA